MKNKPKEKVIGIVGGMGPYAGVELAKKLIEQTNAVTDQEHVPFILISMPNEMDDRSSFIFNETKENPAYAISKIILQLEKLGAEIIGIACITSHSPIIFNLIVQELNNKKSKVKIINIIDETIFYIKELYPNFKRIGILSSNGTYKSKAFFNKIYEMDMEAVVPDFEFQNNIIHRSIYDPRFGLKAKSDIISEEAQELITESCMYFKRMEVDAIILGCTEFSYALKEQNIENMKIIDPLKILSRSLIKEASTGKLRGEDLCI